MRMGNPSVRRWVSKSQCGVGAEVERATYKGVYGKAAIFGLLTLLAAIATEITVVKVLAESLVEALIGIIIGTVVCGIALLIISIVIAFVPSAVKALGMIYCVLQGGLLGCLSLIVDCFVSPGISIAALMGTAIVFLVSLAVNKLFKVKISSKFVRGLMIAFFSILLVQLVMWIMSLVGLFDYVAYLWIQVAVSTLCIIWATIMLTWDLQSIDYIVETGADKKYEWNVSFALVTTIIYLYIEILELLVRLVALFGNKKR